jgi:alkylhydroperoxidase family enzyme
MVDGKKAEGKLAKLYNKLTRSGKNEVAHVLKVQSLNPDLLKDHLNIYKTIMFSRSNLSRMQREMIATVVSNINECHY